MSERVVVGMNPWLPWPLRRSPWWTDPVPAERAAALRIAVALALLLDIILTYLPWYADYYGRNSLGDPAVFADLFAPPHWSWSLLKDVESPAVIGWAIVAWAVLAAGLFLGLGSRFCAAGAWALSVSFWHLNPAVHNAGDAVRNILLFLLIWCPCGAVWSLDAILRRKRRCNPDTHPLYVPAWTLRLLFVQLAFVYLFNGLHKMVGNDWWQGSAVYYVIANPGSARFSYVDVPLPYFITRLLTWSIFIWELGFPLWVWLPSTRTAALWLGVCFHLGLGLFMEVGMFVAYMLCLYVPLVPWERLAGRHEPTSVN